MRSGIHSAPPRDSHTRIIVRLVRGRNAANRRENGLYMKMRLPLFPSARRPSNKAEPLVAPLSAAFSLNALSHRPRSIVAPRSILIYSYLARETRQPAYVWRYAKACGHCRDEAGDGKTRWSIALLVLRKFMRAGRMIIRAVWSFGEGFVKPRARETIAIFLPPAE